jgi:hypothetical protein
MFMRYLGNAVGHRNREKRASVRRTRADEDEEIDEMEMDPPQEPEPTTVLHTSKLRISEVDPG